MDQNGRESVSNLFKALERNRRTWIPNSEVEVIFRSSFIHAQLGTRLMAEDYGHGAFLLTVRGRPRKTLNEGTVSLDSITPIDSGRSLRGGFRAGDCVLHRDRGSGKIVYIDEQNTVFRFDRWGLCDVPTSRAHFDIKFLRREETS